MKKKTAVSILAVLVIASSGGLERSAWSFELDLFDFAASNNTPESATDLGKIGSTPRFYKALTIDKPGDVDYFTWTPLFSDTLQIDILFEDGFGDLDALVRSPRRTLDQSDSLTDNEQLIADVTAGETYLLKVIGYDGSTNAYGLGINYLDKNAPGGGSSGGGGDGGGSSTNPPPPPVVGGNIANQLLGLMAYADEHLAYRKTSHYGRTLQTALKQINNGMSAAAVLRTLGYATNVPRGSGEFYSKVKYVASSIRDIMGQISAETGIATRLSRTSRAVNGQGATDDGQTSVGYDPSTGEVWVDAPAGTELTSFNVDSASGIFTGAPAENLGGSFDNSSPTNIFKATFGSSFGSLSFGNVAQAGLAEEFLLDDLTIVGSLAGGGDLGAVDLIYVPEPSASVLASLGLFGLLTFVRRNRRHAA